MVFENVLSTVLNSVLGDFVENLDAKQLNVGIWGGDVQLKNLIVKPTALDDLDLPVQVVHGKIGNLVLKIPWKSLYNSPTIISVENIFLIVQPNLQVQYDPVKEEKNVYEAKKKEIAKVEAAKKAEAEKDMPKADATFVEKLITNIIKNVQLTIKNIHIRYEDKVTNPSAPFALGATLSNLIVESTDENWKKAIVDDISKIYKIVQLEGLSLYWNCGTKMYAELKPDSLIEHLKQEIASKLMKPEGYHYILGPINSSARLRLNQKPEKDSPPYSFPKVHLNLDMEKLYIGVSKSQYRDIIALASSMDRMTKGLPYRKYRPHLNSYKNHYKEWWHFAYKCVLEEQVRRRRREWDWKHISQYRNTCREYKDLYAKQAKSKNFTPVDKQKLEECEKKLDLTNIVIIRQRIQLEMERLSKSQAKAEKKSWLGWMWGSSSKSDLDDMKKGTAILKQIEEEMTSEEKHKLYKAIDYQENAAPAEYPEEYVDNSLAFLLRSLEIELLDDNHNEFKRVLLTDLKGVKVKLSTRVAASALSAQVKIQDFTTDGMEQDSLIPQIIVSDTHTSAMKGLLDIKFEKNPIDKRCDQRIEVVSMPIKITYDAQTINKIVSIFTIPPDTSLDQIQAAAEDRINNVKNMTATGLQYTIDKHIKIDLNIDLHAPYVVIPYGGKYTGTENVLVLNLGRLKIYSVGVRSSMADVQRLHSEGKDQSYILEFMREHCYDKFMLELMDLQILIAQSDEDWMSTVKESVTSGMHLLEPLSLKVNLSKCLITDDPRLPHTKIRGELPSINVTVSDARVLLLAALATSIEFPSGKVSEESTLVKAGSSTMMLKYKELQESAKKTKDILDKLPLDSKRDHVQFTILDAQFVMSDLSLTINRQSSVGEATLHLVTFKVHTLKLSLIQQTFTSNINLLLESINCYQTRNDQIIDIISCRDVESGQGLFKVEFTQVDSKSPDLHSVHKSCETSLNLNFSVLNIILHQEGLLSIIAFATSIQEEISSLLENKKIDRDRIATAVTESRLQTIIAEAKKTAPLVVESIKFKLKATIEGVTVMFATDAAKISSCSIRGVDTIIIVKNTYTQVNAKLKELSVIDLNPLTCHHMILSGSDDVALTVQIVLNNLTEESNKPDIAVTVVGGGLRIFFLNWFVTNMLNFLNQFQTAQQKIIEASQAAAESARENVKGVYEKATKISLNINLKAPVIVVPVDSKSFHCILLDFGKLTLSNTFLTLDAKNTEGYSAVIDNLKVSLTDLKVSRIVLNEKHEKIHDVYLLEPVTFNVDLKRNLSAGWYTAIPDLDISGKIQTIKLLLAQSDYQMIMSILSGNLAEGQSQQTKVVTKELPSETSYSSEVKVIKSNRSLSVVESSDQLPEKKKAHIFLKFTFTMEQLVISLFTASSSKSLDESNAHNPDDHLAKFSMEGLSLKGTILTDQSLVTSVLLVNCILDDMRKGREGKLNRLIGRTEELYKSIETSKAVDSTGPVRSMIDVTFQQKENDMFADVRVYSFTIILSVDYLLKVADFFNLPKEKQKPQPVKTSSKSGTSLVSKSQSHQETIKADNPSQMTINLKLEKPDIILVEHMDNINTNAIIVNSEILLKLRIAGEHQVINGVMKELSMYTCYFNPARRAESRYNILHPVTLSIAGSTPENKGLHVEMLVTTIHLCVSPAIIELLNKVMVTVTTSQDSQNEETEKEINYTELWQQKPLVETDLWYLKTDTASEALGLLVPTQEYVRPLEELCIISMPKVVVTIEAGVGTKTLPMLIFEAGFKGLARNWSTQLYVEASLTMLMGYYNSRLALWEPLIEPVEEVDEKGMREFVPWEIKLEMSKNQDSEDMRSSMSPTSDDSYELPQPLMSIDITSTNNLELTVTKTLLEVLQNLGKGFASAMSTDNKASTSTSVESSYKVLNEIGEPITLKLEESCFQIAAGGSLDDINKSAAVPLQLKPENVSEEALQLKNELGGSHVRKDNVLIIKVNSKNCELSLPVMRADKRFFMLNYRSNNCPDSWGLVSDVKVDEGITIITIRSILQVYNYFNLPVDVYYMTSKGNELELIGAVQPNGTLNIPLKAVYTPTNELFFAVSGYSISSTPYAWKDLQTKLAVTKILQCTKTSEKGRELFIIKAVGEMEQVFFENTSRHTMASTCFNIQLRPAVILKNFLPLDIVCCVDELAEEFIVKAGDTLQLPSVDPGKNVLVIRIPEYLEKEWSCRYDIEAEPAEFAVWTFNSYDSAARMSLNLGMHTLNKNGSLVMSLYCPFWMLNKTGVMLSYRKSRKAERNETAASTTQSDETVNILHHPPHFKGPILFSFNAKYFFGKKKASIRVESGDWSDKFSLDVAGSSGVINCKSEGFVYDIGVNNQLTYNGLTKQVTFTPYYVIINNAPFAIECQETDRPADPWFCVESKSCTALWPKGDHQDKLLKLRVAGTEETSASFLYTESHTTLLRLNNKYGGINVDIQLTEGGIYINLALYEQGSAPGLLVNDTDHSITYWEKESHTKRTLQPHHHQLYTWENPSGPRILVWDRGHQKEIQNDLRKDVGGEFSPAHEVNICWASFLDGLQRVLLFTEDRSIAESAQASNIFVQFDQEITVSIRGLGISLVNNLLRQEIMYIGIASSGIIWESSKLSSSRFKQMDQREFTHIENAYQQYLLGQYKSEGTSRVLVDGKYDIDFNTLFMYKPNKRKLRRTFQTGLWLQMKSSPCQTQLHAKVNRLQIDNQMFDCIFPVILAPIPPPKSVAADTGIKPFVELSIVQLVMKNSQIREFKYFKALVQEFHIKVDLGFVNALVELFAQSNQSDEEEKQLFLTDMKLVDEALYSHASMQSIQEQKSFYDLLHFSPFKIHVSFSMASGSSAGQIEAPNFLNVLLQGLGVTLTDLQDVVFKLAFFERNFTFLTQKQLVSEATRHYVGQAVKQLYVLVLGLDVLGNPYGLVVGLTKGVEDLFYEPFQGAIQGPGEFAEGLALGVKSLFGHTVGGAAGAMSRITGAMGKGIAALSFDDDFQRKRREQLNKKPANAQEGIARSGKGLVMGVYSGVTGVVTKPLAGAKEEGVEGFFKGLGKGAVGLFVKPVSGVVDFASGSFDVVKRATDAHEDVRRLRPPRFLQLDGLVRPYQKWEAEGNRLLAELSKGKYAKTDYYVNHYTVIPKKEMLLLTDKRLAYICHNDLFGGWQMEWSYTWDEIIKPPQVVSKGVLISTSEKKKKLFSSSDMTKTVLIDDPKIKEEICTKIESLRGT